jgi:hypothetical protein
MRLDGHDADLSSQDGRILGLEDKTASMSTATIQGQSSVVFEGVNLHVRNGNGSTESTNGTGNLIVGYDEEQNFSSDKSGSHNIVYGSENNYTSYGGLIGGKNNEITAAYAATLTGIGGQANNQYSAIVGGYYADAKADYATVVGGEYNDATGKYSVAVGGAWNYAKSNSSTVLGGSDNEAKTSTHATVCGGYYNNATGKYSTVGGGDYVTESRDKYWKGEGELVTK